MNAGCKTIVYDSLMNTYDVYSSDYITMFNNNEIDVDTAGNIDLYEYICLNRCDETTGGGEKPGTKDCKKMDKYSGCQNKDIFGNDCLSWNGWNEYSKYTLPLLDPPEDIVNNNYCRNPKKGDGGL